MKKFLLSLFIVWIINGTLVAQAPQMKVKASTSSSKSDKGTKSGLYEKDAPEHDEHGHHRFYKDTLLAKAGIFYDSLSLKGYRVLTTAQLQGGANYLAKFSNNQTLVNSLVQDNGSKLLVNGAMSIRDSMVINGAMTVNALASLGSGLNVKGTTNFNDSVNVNGPVAMSSALSLNAKLNVSGSASLKNGLILSGLPAGQATDSVLTIDSSGTIRRRNAGSIFSPHPSFADLTLAGPLAGTTARFETALSLGNTSSGIYQWQVTGSNPYLTLSTAANANAFTLHPNGNIGIGTATPGDLRLAVEGTLGARKIKITQESTWADYVFDPAYCLRPLHEVEAFIHTYKHLPEVPTTEEVKVNGVDVGATQSVLLKKVEELTLYVIELKKENEKQQRELEELKKEVRKNQ